ncbi:MAG: Ser/Thr protein kinase RdoA (MazF antagonist) [Candidatus Krumholzibacteriia bacterium]|jgi:Ser/Thr protein kinase RdoA (MazF antagonist)
MSSNDDKATFSSTEMQALILDNYGLTVATKPLPGYQDQNFWTQDQTGRQYVCKVSLAADRDLLHAQHDALIHLDAAVPEIIPTVLETKLGQMMVEIQSPDGQKYLLRLLSFLPGQTMAKSRPISEALWQQLGRTLAGVDQALARFDSPALHYDFTWDLIHGVPTVEANLELVTDLQLQNQFRELLLYYKNECEPLLPSLRKSIIHNDANDLNVLVSGGRITGLIDYGDMIFSHTICDLAICLAYAILDEQDPLQIICLVTAGYHQVYPLTENELKVLYGMICLRMAVSASMSYKQILLRPDDEYLVISQQPIRNTLPVMLAIPPATVETALKKAIT